MTQCGSTRLFNFIIKIYQESSYIVDSCWCKDLYENKYNIAADVLIVKFHDFPEKNYIEKANHIFLPIRDPRDCVISTNKRFFPNEPKNVNKDIVKMVKNIGLFEEWKKHIDPNKIFISKYETFNLIQTQNIAKFLNLKINQTTVVNIMKELDAMHKSTNIVTRDNNLDETYNKTLLSQDHNTSGGKTQKYLEYFSKHEIQRIMMTGKIRNFLRIYGY